MSPRKLDPAALDWLLQGVRELIQAESERVFHLHYWVTFLDQYLNHSDVESPLYLLEVRDGLRKLQGNHLALFDPVFLQHAHSFAAHPRLAGEVVENVGSETREQITSLALSKWSPGLANGYGLAGTVNAFLVRDTSNIADGRAFAAFPTLIALSASSKFGHKPDINWTDADGATVEFKDARLVALSAALATLELDRSLLDYKISLKRPDGDLTGGSLGFPLAILIAGYENLARRREARWPRPDAAFTGAIAEDGTVLPVDAQKLRYKVRAAVGAGFATFAFPAENSATVEQECVAIHALDATLRLPVLVPVRHLREVFERPELVRTLPGKDRPPIPSDRPLWALAVLAFALGVGAYWLFGNPWTERARVETSGTFPAVVRASMPGWPPRSRTFHFAASVNKPEYTVRVARLAPDQSPSLIVGTGPEGSEPCRVHVFDLKSGRERWQQDLSHRAALSDSAYVVNRFAILEVTLVDLDVDGKLDLIARAQAAPESPCTFVWYSPDGVERGYYAHRGYIFFPQTSDYDHDGNPELFLRGTLNNGTDPYGQDGTAVVLNSTHFSAWPSGGPFVGSPAAPYDSSLATIVFPLILEHCVAAETSGYTVNRIHVSSQPPPSRLSINVGPANQPGLIVTLDEDFRVVSVIAEDDLRPLVDGWLAEGRLRESFISDSRLREYAARIRVRRPDR